MKSMILKKINAKLKAKKVFIAFAKMCNVLIEVHFDYVCSKCDVNIIRKFRPRLRTSSINLFVTFRNLSNLSYS